MKRMISLVLCVVLCFSCLSVPSFAGVSDAYVYAVDTFPSFLRRYLNGNIITSVPDYLVGIGDALINGTATDADVQTGYDSYVMDLPSSLYGSDAYPIYVPTLMFYSGTKSSSAVEAVGAGSFSFSGSQAATSAIRYISQTFMPVCHGQIGFSCNVSAADMMSLDVGVQVQQLDGSWSTITGSQFYSRYVKSGFNDTVIVDNYGLGSLNFTSSWFQKFRLVVSIIPCSPYSVGTVNLTNIKFYQYSVTGGSYVPSNIFPVDTRAPSIIINIINSNSTSAVNKYYIGTKTGDTITNVYETNIFNETTKVLTLPGETPVTYNITNWNYDYSTRTYNLTDGTSNYVVTYGDDYITITVPDGNGGTISTNYYYVVQEPVPVGPGADPDTGLPIPSTDNYEDDPNTTGGFFSSIWKAFKEGLASLISGIIKGLFKGIKALIDGITSVFSGLVSGFFGFVTSFFDSFGTGPGAVGEFFGGGVVDLG